MCAGVAIARTGEMEYGVGETPIEPDSDGRVIVTRDESEVFRPETMASFEGKAVTILHPNDFVSPKNWSQLTKGMLLNVRRGTGDQSTDLLADLLITDAEAIALVKNGLREVSCGYEAEYVQSERGRGIQKKIIGNHVALVDQGRAGSAYAINDHKGKGIRMALKDKLKGIFAKATDEALACADADEPKKDEPKKDDAKDVAGVGYDELMKAVKDLGEKVAAMAPKKDEPKDALTAPTENEPAAPAKDEDEPVAPSLEERLTKLEMAVAKLLESQATGDAEGDDVVTDEDGDDDDETEDDDFEESTMTGDAVSRVEILAPGLSSKGKGVKAKALLAAYATKDGKSVIDRLNGGKAPNVKDAAQVETLFVAASELLKTERTADFSKTKIRDSVSGGVSSVAKTAEQINEMNAKHYGQR